MVRLDITLSATLAIAGCVLPFSVRSVAAVSRPSDEAGTRRVAGTDLPAVERIADNGNLPLNSALFSGSLDYGDLARQGYVEREYYLTGKASTRDQESGAVIERDLPYVTRMVVRMPLNPARFSGNVVIEPFHGQMETAVMWSQLHSRIVHNGDVWVGFTVKPYSVDMEPTGAYNLGGIPLLKAYDADRYGRLQLAPDMRPLAPPPPPRTPPQALDLLGQVAAVFKLSPPNSPLARFRVRHVYAVGNGMSGEVVSGFVRTGQDAVWVMPDGRPVIDGYLFNNSTRLPPPAPKGAALVMIRSEHEIERAAFLGFMGRNPDAPAYRVYDVPGTAHLGTRDMTESGSGARQMNALLPKPDLKMPWTIDATQCPNLNDEPADLFLAAILARMEQWGASRVALPVAPPVRIHAGDPGGAIGDPTSAGPFDPPVKVALTVRDPRDGNVEGGVRMPWIAAPIARYLSSVAAQAPGANPPSLRPVDGWPRAAKDTPTSAKPRHGGRCILENPRLAYGPATLRAIYGSYGDYVRRFAKAKADAVGKGWLLREDAATLQPRGDPADFR